MYANFSEKLINNMYFNKPHNIKLLVPLYTFYSVRTYIWVIKPK